MERKLILKETKEIKLIKVKDTSQEEIEKGKHIIYPLILNFKNEEQTVNNKKEFNESLYWQNLKFQYAFFLRRNSKKTNVCEKCGKEYKKSEIQLHHLTYKNIGNESFEELMHVCFICHSKIHKTKEKNKKEYDSNKKFNKKNLFNLTDLILFGKYKEEKLTLKKLIAKDKNYVLWLIKNEVIRVNEKVIEEIDRFDSNGKYVGEEI